MTILCFALTVVVPVANLDRKFAGGLAAYESKARALGLDFCNDGIVTGAYFRSPDEVGRWNESLKRGGLTYFEGDEEDPGLEAQDFTVVDMLTGPVLITPWLSHSFESGRRLAWSAGSRQDEPVIPKTFDVQAIEEAVFVSNEELRSNQTPMGPGVLFLLPGHPEYPELGRKLGSRRGLFVFVVVAFVIGLAIFLI